MYDRHWNQYIRKTLLFLKDWAKIPPGARVLDLACGTGEFERLLLQENPTQPITAVDISERMLAIAQQKLQAYPTVSFLLASATALPFADSSFDTIISASSFHYFDNPGAANSRVERPNCRYPQICPLRV